jgi:S-adenosylmethionine hydrolase
VLTAALELDDAYRYFPPGTVFLVVVDPGVGTSRRAIAMEAEGYRFVGPDNGVLSLVAARCPEARVVELTEARYARSTISKTFEGRDRFAPAAAWLASGVEPTSLGPAVGSLVRLDVPVARRDARRIDGEVLRVDRFGNLITNIDGSLVDALPSPVVVDVNSVVVSRVVATYSEVPAGALCALVGSSGLLEIAVNGGSAASTLAAGRGAAVRVHAAA